jgi:hypothetical protein
VPVVVEVEVGVQARQGVQDALQHGALVDGQCSRDGLVDEPGDVGCR